MEGTRDLINSVDRTEEMTCVILSLQNLSKRDSRNQVEIKP